MIKLGEEGMSKTQISWTVGFLHQKVSQIVITKEAFLKEIKSSTSVNTRMIQKKTALPLTGMEKVSITCIVDQTITTFPQAIA